MNLSWRHRSLLHVGSPAFASRGAQTSRRPTALIHQSPSAGSLARSIRGIAPRNRERLMRTDPSPLRRRGSIGARRMLAGASQNGQVKSAVFHAARESQSGTDFQPMCKTDPKRGRRCAAPNNKSVAILRRFFRFCRGTPASLIYSHCAFATSKLFGRYHFTAAGLRRLFSGFAP